MRHLLIDYDSTIPNLALMKISAWAKAKGQLPTAEAVALEEADLNFPAYGLNPGGGTLRSLAGYFSNSIQMRLDLDDAHEELSCADAGYCHV